MKQILLAVIILFSSCEININTNKNPEEVQHKRELYIPNGWTLHPDNEKGDNNCSLHSPRSDADSMASINIFGEELEGWQFEKYLTYCKTTLEKSYPDMEFISEGKINFQGKEGFWYRYNLSPMGVKMSAITFVVPNKGTAYVVNCSTAGRFDRYKSTFDSVATSLFFIE